jgi:hypothetical protein
MKTGYLPSRKTRGVMCSLAFLLTFSSGCTALRSSSLPESRTAHAPDHDCVAWHYREDALRLLTESNRHSVLAVQYAEMIANRPAPGLWRDLVEYYLRLASYEHNVAAIMTAIAVTHWQLAHDSQPPGKTEDSP